MLALTPSERRGALVLVLLLLIGAGHDLWRARGPGAGPAAGPRDGRLAPSDSLPPPAAAGAGSAESAGTEGAPDASPPVPRASGAPVTARRGRVDLNRAGVRELDTLPGIGPVIAERIVLQRRRYGPFEGIDELLAVRGVGPRLLERIRPWATVGPRPAAEMPLPAAARLDSATRTGR